MLISVYCVHINVIPMTWHFYHFHRAQQVCPKAWCSVTTISRWTANKLVCGLVRVRLFFQPQMNIKMFHPPFCRSSTSTDSPYWCFPSCRWVWKWSRYQNLSPAPFWVQLKITKPHSCMLSHRFVSGNFRQNVNVNFGLNSTIKLILIFLLVFVVIYLGHHDAVNPKDLSTVRCVMSGAAPLGALDAERFLKK